MAAKHNSRPIAILPLFLFLLFISRCVEAQSPPNESTNSSNNSGQQFQSVKFNPSIVIIIVILVSAFFLLGFFSIYIRQCSGDEMDPVAAAAAAAAVAAGRARMQRGLEPLVIQTFPTLVYSEVKEHKIGKGALECAICLNEFEDDETIRLLPKCDHVFHQECIDAWLDTHVTCPVCRTNYDFNFADHPAGVPAGNDVANVAPVPPETAEPPDAPPVDHVAISVDDVERKEEMRELARIASRVRGNGARRSKRLSRSHSTGHSIMQQGEAGLDRYTLRLPEKVRKEIIAAGRMQRAKTFGVTVRGAGEGSMRTVSRGVGEGSSRRNRTIRLGRSERWPSFFGRSLSAKISTWGQEKG